MTKNELKDKIIEILPTYLPGHLQWEVGSNTMVNSKGKQVETITISVCGESSGMMVSLDQIMEGYKSGASIPIICQTLAEQIQEIIPNGGLMLTDEITDFEKMKKRIVASVINQKNVTPDRVHRRHEDLAIVYSVLLNTNEEQTTSMQVTDICLKNWNVSEEEIYELAMKNTKKLLPMTVESMREKLSGLLYFELDIPDVALDEQYVISNTYGTRGAIYMFDIETLTKISDVLNTDLLYIYPSSIHEIIVTKPTEEIDFNKANELVSTVSMEVNSETDFLSDHAYLFDKSIMQVISL